jgi:hypothetical protein
MKRCINPNCGRELADATEVCGNCGVRQPAGGTARVRDRAGGRNQAVEAPIVERITAVGDRNIFQVIYNRFSHPGIIWVAIVAILAMAGVAGLSVVLARSGRAEPPPSAVPLTAATTTPTATLQGASPTATVTPAPAAAAVPIPAVVPPSPTPTPVPIPTATPVPTATSSPTSTSTPARTTIPPYIATLIAVLDVVGSISVKGQYQDWKFAGQQGDIVTIRMLRDNNVSLEPRVGLIDGASGRELSDSGCYGHPVEARVQNHTLPVSGSYVIRAAGCAGTIGAYTLSLGANPPPILLTYGQQVSGTFPISNAYQDRRFEGVKGEVVTIRMLRDNNVSLEPRVGLIDGASGRELSDSGCYGHPVEARVQNHTLPVSGSYVIRAAGCAGTIGAYTLSLTTQ